MIAAREAEAQAIRDSQQQDAEDSIPQPIQSEALDALRATRAEGYVRGLVVMATGIGKTFLSAFDSLQQDARSILFVAHREEILRQTERTFRRVIRDLDVIYFDSRTVLHGNESRQLVLASVQALSRAANLRRVAEQDFDYVVVDEFHHAAAPTYQRMLTVLSPQFLLGLTATPGRTDGASILDLCDDNEVFRYELFDAIADEYLCPFHYYGIADTEVEYEAIPWRNGRFDPEDLSAKLATRRRAEHAVSTWRMHGRERTLAFCISRKHADFMAREFCECGIEAVSVHGTSEMSRVDAIQALENGTIEVIFSVDLFSEGLDVPLIDTIMMLRPTESKIMFLQQLGRGLRTAEGKDHVTVLDFIGNHLAFLRKPQALLGLDGSTSSVREFLSDYRTHELLLPKGCFVNFDLQAIAFLDELSKPSGVIEQYMQLKHRLNEEEDQSAGMQSVRPSLSEFARSGARLQDMRREFGSWFEMVRAAGDLSPDETHVLANHLELLETVESTSMTKSFKMVLLRTFAENGGFASGVEVSELSARSKEFFARRPDLRYDLKESFRALENVPPKAFEKYWLGNPVRAWTGSGATDSGRALFNMQGSRFEYANTVANQDLTALHNMIEELVSYRLLRYGFAERDPKELHAPDQRSEVLSFPTLPVACGHFREGSTSSPVQESVHIPQPSLAAYFTANAAGDSMDAGDRPIKDGDRLLCRLRTRNDGAISNGAIVVLERARDGVREYVLRQFDRTAVPNKFVATHKGYDAIAASSSVTVVAELTRVVKPSDSRIGHRFLRHDVEALLGAEWNPKVWQVGFLPLYGQRALVLFVTLDKQDLEDSYKYHDRWVGHDTFVWQSQNRTAPSGKHGQLIINHEKERFDVHLFVRHRRKTREGKAEAFVYHGRVRYVSHTGSKPMTVTWRLQ